MPCDSSFYHGYFHSPLGALELCASDRGITSLQFIEEPDLTEDCNQVIQTCKGELEAYFKGGLKEFSVSIDLKCTDFQKQVLSYVSAIPLGATVSYSQIAKTMSMPTASRAIGMANSKNRVLIIIPCHRVVGQGGKLVGYAGELYRKQWLLDHEAKICGITKDQLSFKF